MARINRRAFGYIIGHELLLIVRGEWSGGYYPRWVCLRAERGDCPLHNPPTTEH